MTVQIPGWYPDPHSPGVVRWHDGLDWTEHTDSALERATTWGRPALGGGWFRLSTAVQLLLAAHLALDAMGLTVLYRMGEVAERGAQAVSLPQMVVALRQANALLGYAGAIGLGLTVVELVVGLLFVWWLYQVHRSSALDASQLRHRSGWAVAGWLVPVLNLWRPHQVVQDTFRGARGGGPDSVLVLVWWVATVATALGSVTLRWWDPTSSSSPRDEGEALRAAHDLGLAVMGLSVLSLVAAVLAILVVHRVRSAVRTRLAGLVA